MTIQLEGIRRRADKVLEEYQAPLGDVLATSAQEALHYSPFASGFRMLELGIAEEPSLSPPISAKEARQRADEAGVRLSIPDDGIRERALDLLIERKREERRRQDILARAPQGAGTMGLRFAAGLAGSLLDPLNIAVSFIPVVGEARYGAMLARQTSRLGRAAVRLRVGALEGAVGAATVEPLVLAAATQEQADYHLSDSLLNIAFGTALGAGLHTGAGAVADAIRARLPRAEAPPLGPTAERLVAAPPAVREAALRAAVAQEASGYRASVEPLVGPTFHEISSLEASLRAAPTIEARLTARLQEIDAQIAGAPVQWEALQTELRALTREQDLLQAQRAELRQAEDRAQTREARRQVSERFVGRKQREAAVAERIGAIRDTLAAAPRMDVLQAQRAKVQTALEGQRQGQPPDLTGSGIQPEPLTRRALGDLLERGGTGRRTVQATWAVAERAAAPENVRVADFEASTEAAARLQAAVDAVDESTAREELAAEMDALTAEGGTGAPLAEFDARIADADELRDVLRAAALCHMRKG